MPRLMDLQLADLLRELETAAQQHGGTPRIAREANQFLNILVKATGAKNLLEVGTTDGYASLWLAEAAEANGGMLTTIESDVWRADMAREVLARSPHTARIRLMQGEMLELLPVLEGPFDFVVLDGENPQALHYLRILAEQISSRALICCANAIGKASQLAEYLSYVHERPGLESTLVPIGEGIEITYKVP